MTQRIAIIGTGISGLTCAHLLHRQHDITVFEANNYIGGHTATVDVEVNDREYAIDTGFIVYNDWTYPNFIKLMQQLNVETQVTEMSFSVKDAAINFEYNGHNLNALFAQRRNLVRPKFWGMLRDILRFNKLCKTPEILSQAENKTLWDLIEQEQFGDHFAYYYILPMCAAIWSTSLEEIKRFPLKFFLQFFNNHGLLNIADRPQWHTLVGGSRSYIGPMTKGFESKIRLNSPVLQVRQENNEWIVVTPNGEQQFDSVILACHSDQALNMLEQPSTNQQEILGNIQYAGNDVVLHTDIGLLPKRELAWASWNYNVENGQTALKRPATVTYNMNILQRLQSDTTFLVTLNNTDAIDPTKILRKFHYSHPQFNQASLLAQSRREEICGQNDLHFCGAYWYNGFHEDGVKSALDVCERFGVSL